MRVANNAEGGTSTVTVTALNSNSNSGTPFDTVSIGANHAITYSTTAAHGSLGFSHVASASSAGGYTGWQSATLGSAIRWLYFRASVNPAANPATDLPIVSVYGAGSLRASLWITSTGALRWKNAAGSTIQTTTNTLTATSWARVEGFVGGDNTAGQVDTRLYKTQDSTTATEIQTSGATEALGGTIDEIRFGNTTGVSGTVYLDDLAVSDTGYLGPANITSFTTWVLPASAYPVYAVVRPTETGGWHTAIPRPTSGQLWPRGSR